jgi:predicted Zn-dependent peptidase
MLRRLTLAVAALAFSAPLPATGADYPPKPIVGPTKPYTVPASESYQLPNGMHVTLVPFGQVPKATIYLAIDTGAIDDGSNVGLASLTSQMLREGAAGRTGAEVAANAASMGGGLIVGSGLLLTTAAISVLSDRTPAAVRLIGDVAEHPNLPASEFERVRQNYLRSIAVAKSQPQTAADAALHAAYYGADTPYGRTYPTDAQAQSYTIADVRRFYGENFGARRARLYVAGQFDAAAVKAAIEQTFGNWTPGPPDKTAAPTPHPGPKVILIDRPGTPQSTVRLAFAAPAAGSPNDIPFQVTDALLGGAFTSRITHNIREVKGYTYSPYSYIDLNPGGGRWEFDADITTDVTGPALKEVFGEIRRLQTEPVPDDEATGIRRWIAGTFVLQNASYGGLIGSLHQRDYYGLPADWLTTYVPRVLAVQDNQLTQLSREYMPLDKMTLVVVGDLPKIEPQLKALPELQGWQFERVKPF